MNLNSQGGDIFLFKLTSSMTLYKGRFPNTAVTDQKKLELRYSGHDKEIETLTCILVGWMRNVTRRIDT